jgi:Glycosyltransferase
MVDAAIEWAKTEPVFFITVEPRKPFYSAGGKETIIELLGKEKSNIQVVKKTVGWEFEFGTSDYRRSVYEELISENVPRGTSIILSDDATIWSTSTNLFAHYKIISVLHGNDDAYYDLVGKYHATIHGFACVSHRIRNIMLDRYPFINIERTAVIPCGIDMPEFIDREHANNQLRLVFVGRIDQHQKRVLDIHKIAVQLSQAGIDYMIDIIGEGAEREKMAQLFEQDGLGNRIVFHGWKQKTEIYSILFNEDILLLTSDVEGMPIAMMEGLACGCSVVGTRISGIEDYEFADVAKDCLRVFGVGDIKDAVDKILSLTTTQTQKTRSAARYMAENEFAMPICIQRYSSLIKTIQPIEVGDELVSNGNRAFSQLYSYCRALFRRARLSIKK